MNGDVTSREQGLALAREYGIDGAMIATAAEANSSVFRTKEQGGLLPWREVVKDYIQLAMSVENKFGNTKFLLSQLMPGKDAAYQQVQKSRSYAEVISLLDMTDLSIIEKAKEIDHILKLDVPLVTKADIKRQNKQQTRENQSRKQEKKRAFGQDGDHNQERSKKQKAEIAAENAGFEGFGQGFAAVTA
jgi:tRNA-dihydrouridine synthase 2